MAIDVLQTFLNNRLLEAIGPDDSRLERLRSAAADLAEKLREDPDKTLAWTVAALNPRTPGNVPAFEEVGLALANHWPTYGNLFPGTPVTVFRAMLLTALSTVIDEDERVAFAFALVSRNLLPHLELGIEARAIQPLVDAAEEIARRAVGAEWGLGVDNLESAEFEMLKIGSEGPKIRRPWLQGLIEGAVGPTNAKGEAAGTKPNPHWPNSPDSWAHEFVPRMTAAVAGAVDGGVDALRKEGISAAETLAAAVQTYVRASVEQMAVTARV
ncbi:GTPase-associated system all-helical protein GASH [Methylobacterium sp. D54C]